MGFYIRHFAGFLIQIGSGMLLCVMPFGDGAFRINRKWVLAGCGLLALVSSAFFPIVIGMEKFSSTTYQSMAANLYMLSALVIFVILYFCVLQVEMVKRVLALVLALFYAATQYLLVNLILSLYNGGSDEVYSPMTLVLFAGSAVIMLPGCALFMQRVVRDYLEEIEPHNINREFGVVILTSFFLYGNVDRLCLMA